MARNFDTSDSRVSTFRQIRNTVSIMKFADSKEGLRLPKFALPIAAVFAFAVAATAPAFAVAAPTGDPRQTAKTTMHILDKDQQLARWNWRDNLDNDWFKTNIPFFESPDEEVDKTYYYRWELATKHMVYGSPQTGYTFTEFIRSQPWAGQYGAISCPMGLQLYELRWLKNRDISEDFARYWYDASGAQPRSYSNWYGDALWANYLVSGDKPFITGLLPSMEKQYQGWLDERWDKEHQMFAWSGMHDGMEFTIGSRQTTDEFAGAPSYRPTLNAYVYGDLKAMAKTATLAGETDKAAEFETKADALKKRVLDELWDPQRQFFMSQFARDEEKNGDLVKAKSLMYQTGKYAGDSHGRELSGLVPWMFDLPPKDQGYEAAWKNVTDPQVFFGPRGLYFTEVNDPLFTIAPVGCVWSGNDWPYANSQVLQGMANVLNDYPQTAISHADYWKVFQLYALSQRKNGAPYIAETADPNTGRWTQDDVQASEHYFHSSFNDLLITGLVGLRPRADNVVEVNPLAPRDWNYFALDDVSYHGHNLSIVWDLTGKKYGRGAGLSIFADGKRIANAPQIGKLTATLPAVAAPAPTRAKGELRAVNFAVNNDSQYFPRARASSSAPNALPREATDGIFYYEFPRPVNRWTTQSAPAAQEWFELDFGAARPIDTVKLYVLDDAQAAAPSPIRAPAAIELQYLDGKKWRKVPGQTLNPAIPQGHLPNVISFPTRNIEKLRAVFTPKNGAPLGLSEFEAWGKSPLPLSAPRSRGNDLARAATPSASYISRYDQIGNINDGKEDMSGNGGRWTAYESPNSSDWLQLDWKTPQTFSRVELLPWSDGGDTRPPKSVKLQWWDGQNWEDVSETRREPAQMTAQTATEIQFAPVSTTRLRATFEHDLPAKSGSPNGSCGATRLEHASFERRTAIAVLDAVDRFIRFKLRTLGCHEASSPCEVPLIELMSWFQIGSVSCKIVSQRDHKISQINAESLIHINILSSHIEMNSSKFLTCALFLCALFFDISSARAEVTRQDLGGAWLFHQDGKTDEMPAQVPGSVFLDLMRAQKVPDPFVSDNEKKVQWVGESAWVYHRQFSVAPALLTHQFVLLNGEGLDTLATIRLNGKLLGATDNMFRRWQFDAKPLLQVGANELEIRFESTFPLDGPEKKSGIKGRYIRKAPYHYGWDWGPTLVDAGVWKPIGLLAYDTARIGDIGIAQDHSQVGVVGLTSKIALADAPPNAELRARVTVELNGKMVGSDVQNVRNGNATSAVSIRDPQLWWPNEMGGHPLYDVKIELLNGDQILDSKQRRIGLRTIALLPANAERAVQLSVNGVPFFAKGSNWIPSDSFAPRVTNAKLRAYVAAATASHMNMLRFWGGGYYEEDALFDACDESGILVWEDFKFANNWYPSADPIWMDNVRAEVAQQVERLHTHPCIAVWCGNNEIEAIVGDDWRAGYNQLFGDLIGGAVRQKLPDAVYTLSSPGLGDEHYWGVYHVGQSFEAFRGVHGFISEFGMQSFPEPRSVDEFTSPADRVSTDTAVMSAHQKGKGNATILDYINRYFRAPRSFDDTLWLSQIMQGYGVQTGVESWRREMPRSTGSLIWQLDDCWPVASWSAIDSYGRPKALQYLTRHFYAPLLVSGVADAQSGRVSLWLTSDLRQKTSSTLRWQVTDCAGNWLRTGKIEAEIGPQSSREIANVDLSDLLQEKGAGDLLIWLYFEGDDAKVLSENLVFFGRPKSLKLQNPQIQTHAQLQGDGFLVTLTAQKTALWTWLSLESGDATYDDNFFHLRANEPRQILVTPASPLSLAEFEARIRVHSLTDTFDPKSVIGDPNDLAQSRPIIASSTEENNGNIPANAVDGDDSSRWSSGYGDPQWLAVDLGEFKPITKVKLKWETAFASAYQIQVSDDGHNWRTVYATENGRGGVEEIALPDDLKARWVRMLGTKRATNFGYSLWSFGVYQ